MTPVPVLHPSRPLRREPEPTKAPSAAATLPPAPAATVKPVETPALAGPVESLSARRSWREDHVQTCNFYQGITTHKNVYDFVTISPIEVVSTKQAMKPAGTKLFEWIDSWKI